MKNLLAFPLLVLLLAMACTTQKPMAKSPEGTGAASDTVRIANQELEYEIIIIDPGFNGWFNAYAKPRGYYPQQYLEARNREWVVAWNMRASNPAVYGNLNLFPIDYSNNIDYGYEVNYMLYYYLTYFQIVNNLRLGSFTPRI